jgi:hypothetical protein
MALDRTRDLICVPIQRFGISEIDSKLDEANIDHTGLKAGNFDIAVHIRPDDKHYGMSLVPDQAYIRTVKLVDKLVGRKVSVFLLTDDDRSVRSFEAVEGINLYLISMIQIGMYTITKFYMAMEQRQ